MSKLWVFIGAATGMPLKVEKCEFKPTILPGNGDWERVYRKGEMTELETLEHEIKGHMDAMKPLLHKWDELRQND